MTWQPEARQLAGIKAGLFLICLLPFGRLLWAAWSGDFGPEPVAFVQRWTGTWTFNLLLLTLGITPLRVMTQLHWLLRLRRLLGLFCFFYATLHLLAFIGFEHGFAVDDIARDIFKRPYVSAGFAAVLLLIPLAATSNRWALRHLGGRKWQELHRSVYLAGILAAIHYLWLAVTEDTALLWPVSYALALGLLLGWRVRERRRKAIPVPRFAAAKPLKFFKRKPD